METTQNEDLESKFNTAIKQIADAGFVMDEDELKFFWRYFGASKYDGSVSDMVQLMLRHILIDKPMTSNIARLEATVDDLSIKVSDIDRKEDNLSTAIDNFNAMNLSHETAVKNIIASIKFHFTVNEEALKHNVLVAAKADIAPAKVTEEKLVSFLNEIRNVVNKRVKRIDKCVEDSILYQQDSEKFLDAAITRSMSKIEILLGQVASTYTNYQFTILHNAIMVGVGVVVGSAVSAFLILRGVS